MKKLLQSFFRIDPLYRHLIYWAISIFLIYILSHSPSLIETLYFKGIYPLIAISNRWFFSFFGISIGDLLYVLGLLYLIYLLIKFLFHFKNFKENLLALSRFLLIVFWLFYLSWGLNYFRPSLSEKLKLENTKYTVEDLVKLGNMLVDSTHYYQMQLTQNDSLPVEVTYGIQRILNKTPEGYKQISKYIKQSYISPVIKTSLLSKAVSYLHVTGYLNPFTNEAQINRLYPKFALPFIASHEVAHQLGYAPEDEANFLGFLSSTHHPDPYFKYSGYSAALYYVMSELKKYAPEDYKNITRKLHKGVKKNYGEEYRFYIHHKTNFDSAKIYDSYLKLNKQKAGIKSYNQMIKLLVAYYKATNQAFNEERIPKE